MRHASGLHDHVPLVGLGPPVAPGGDEWEGTGRIAGMWVRRLLAVFGEKQGERGRGVWVMVWRVVRGVTGKRARGLLWVWVL